MYKICNSSVRCKRIQNLKNANYILHYEQADTEQNNYLLFVDFGCNFDDIQKSL